MAESVASSSAKRVCRPLKKKIEVLQEVKRRPKVTVRELAQLVQDGIASLEQVQHFLEFRGMMHKATVLSQTVDDLARVSANSSQTTLYDYFH